MAQHKRTAENSIGYLLWEARTKQGYELEEIAEVIRIRTVFLRDIEQDRFDTMPGGAYLTGYLRAYGRFLGLDPEEVLERFRQEHQPEANENEFFQPDALTGERFLPHIIVGICLVLALAAYGGWYFWHKDDFKPAPQGYDVPENMQEYLNPHKDLDSSNPQLPVTESEPTPAAPAPEAEVKPVEEPVKTVKTYRRKRTADIPQDTVQSLTAPSGTMPADAQVPQPAPEAPAQ